VRSSTADTVARGAAWEGEAVLAAVAIMKGAMVASIMEAVAARAARAPVEPATTLFDWWREECCWALVPGTLVRCLPGRRALLAPAAGWLLHGRPAGRPTLPTAAGCGVLAARVCQVCGRGRSGHFVGLSIVQQPTAAPGHPDWDGQADARWPRPWLAPGMWHPRIPLSSRMSRAARAASPVRDPPGAALTWVRRCLAVWEGCERPFQGASGRQPALSSGGGGPFAGATQRLEYV
jgi:hypothetical protein